MNEKDFKIIKALADLELHKEQPLTPEQEQLLKQALDPEEKFLSDVEKIFNNP